LPPQCLVLGRDLLQFLLKTPVFALGGGERLGGRFQALGKELGVEVGL
jgi:hypothetical protein